MIDLELSCWSSSIVSDLLPVDLSLQLIWAVLPHVVLRSCESIHRVSLLKRALLERPVYLGLHLVVQVLEAALKLAQAFHGLVDYFADLLIATTI